MKHHIDKFLLGILWLLAAILGANFWFNITFGFNIFARAHWKYLSELQIAGTQISKSFYISFVVIITLVIIGLYILMRPKFQKKIVFNKPDVILQPTRPLIQIPEKNNKIVQNQSITAQILPSSAPVSPARPPKLAVSPVSMQSMTVPRIVSSGITNPPNVSAILQSVNKSNQHINDEDKNITKQIFSDANYIVKSAPKIDNVKLDIWATGTDEFLLTGLIYHSNGDIIAKEGGDSKWRDNNGEFISPVWQLTEARQKLQELFNETLDQDIKINMKSFVIILGGNIINRESVQTIWDAFDIMVFTSIDELKKYFSGNKNPELTIDAKEDFEAYDEYINTVADYFNKQVN